MLADLPLVKFALNEVERLAKHDALLCHRSQLQHAGGDPILPAELLGPAEREYEVFLPR
jgi:hypothetical protein